MHVRHIQDIDPHVAAHGETVRELGGHTAGGLAEHSVAHITLPPGVSSLKHFHPEVEESYYVLTGIARVEIDGQTRRLVPGQLVAIRPSEVHQVFNDTDDDVALLVTCTPPWTPDCSVFVGARTT